MGKHSHSLLATVGSEHEILLIRNKDTCNPGEIRNRTQILVSARIDQVDRVVGCVGDVEYSGFVMDGGMVEAALLLVRR